MGGYMNFVLHPWQLFFLILSGFVNRRQQEIIDDDLAVSSTMPNLIPPQVPLRLFDAH
jgi:hypothetical protein